MCGRWEAALRERPALAGKIDATLPILNHQDCWKQREEYVDDYNRGPDGAGISLSYLERRAPFIAAELRRQGRLVRGDV